MHPTFVRRLATCAAAITLTASLAGAQTDPRWRAWTGCWTPIAQNQFSGGGTVCVLPTEKPSAVEIVTIADGKIGDRTRIDADGVAHPVSRDGCVGSETAKWSTTGTRVHIAESVTCTGGGVRRGTGIMSFTQQYEWLDVRGISSGGAAGVAVAKYQLTFDTTGIPAEVRLAAMRGPSANNALLAASAPLTLADIADVATQTDSGVAATWLTERTRDLKLVVNGKQLEALADQGVPASVIDVIVALAHPTVFALNSGATEPQVRDQPRSASGGQGDYWRRYPSYYSPYYSSFYDPWYGYFGYYSPYGLYGWDYRYRSYGFGYGYPGAYSPYYGGGYYPGSQPIIVVTRPSQETNPNHGRVVKGRGYTSGTGSSGGSTASAPSSSSGSSGGSSSGSASSSAGSSGGGGGRVAVRKPPQ